MNACRGLILTGLCLMVVARAFANTFTIIYDNGDTQPLAPFLEVFGESPESERADAAASPSLGAAELRQLLPITSPQLTPGPVARQKIARPFTAPMFLIGSDPLSARWLLQHRARLAKLGAVGLIVEVPEEAALQRIIALAAGLTLLPASGSDLAETLDLTHYPVLITQDGIEQ